MIHAFTIRRDECAPWQVCFSVNVCVCRLELLAKWRICLHCITGITFILPYLYGLDWRFCTTILIVLLHFSYIGAVFTCCVSCGHTGYINVSQMDLHTNLGTHKDTREIGSVQFFSEPDSRRRGFDQQQPVFPEISDSPQVFSWAPLHQLCLPVRRAGPLPTQYTAQLMNMNEAPKACFSQRHLLQGIFFLFWKTICSL